MSHRYTRHYTGPIEGVVLDWAGTVCDYGCRAPVEAFIELFRREGLSLTPAQAREPMGTEKREHIRRVLGIPAVAAAWQAAKGSAASEAEIDRLYTLFEPIQLETIRRNAALIPGTIEAVAALRARGIRIGANTGYNRRMLAVVEESAAREGYRPEVSLASEDAPRGRPWPDLALAVAARLQLSSMAACVKVDDTVPGVEEGLACGMWSIGVALTGNELGLSLAEWRALDARTQTALRERASERLRRAGAHLVLDSVAQLDAAIGELNQRLARGEKP